MCDENNFLLSERYFEMRKSMMINSVEDGKQFIYNNTIYTKIKSKSSSSLIDGDYTVGVSLSGEHAIILHWSISIKIEVPDVKLSSIAIGKKFKYNEKSILRLNMVQYIV